MQLKLGFESTYYYLGRAQVDPAQDAAGIANLQSPSIARGDTTLNTLLFYQLARVYRRMHRMDEANAVLAQFRTLRDAAEKMQADKRASKQDRQPSVITPRGADSYRCGWWRLAGLTGRSAA